MVVVPVLGRPHRVEPFLASLAKATPEPHRALFIADCTDWKELEALEAAGADYKVQPPPERSFAQKINRGIELSWEPFIFTAADDLDFHDGWLKAAFEVMKPGIDVVGTFDAGNVRTLAGTHSTHSLVRRSYVEQFGTVDEPGKLFHEGYPHDYCDDELVQTAIARGRYAHAWDSVVEHLHPLWGKGEMDATYEKGRAGSAEGRRVFESRKHLWQIPIEWPPIDYAGEW